MVENRKLNSPYLIKALKLSMSSIKHLELNLGKGKEKDNDQVIIFSHGKTATPFMYTNLFKAFGRERKIYAPQHS